MKKRDQNKYGILPNDSKAKQILKKFWFTVWKDDSLKGWIFSLIFLFIVIKGIFFPLMSLATGTELPLVIVESCSMYHDGNLFSDTDEWWKNHDMKYFKLKISEKDWRTFPFQKGFNKGDILFITGVKPSEIEIGDVVIFTANYRNPIIHRVINITQQNNQYYFSTIGDNNNGQIEFEKNISENQIVGKAQANIAPFLGWGKLIFFEGLRPSSQRGLCQEN